MVYIYHSPEFEQVGLSLYITLMNFILFYQRVMDPLRWLETREDESSHIKYSVHSSWFISSLNTCEKNVLLFMTGNVCVVLKGRVRASPSGQGERRLEQPVVHPRPQEGRPQWGTHPYPPETRAGKRNQLPHKSQPRGSSQRLWRETGFFINYFNILKFIRKQIFIFILFCLTRVGMKVLSLWG